MKPLYYYLKRSLYSLCPSFWDKHVKHKSKAKYAIAGIGVSFIDLFSLYIFHGVFHVEIVRATTFAFLCSFLLSFSLQKFWTFSNHHISKKVFSKQLSLYVLINLINININGAIMYFLVNHYGIWYLISQVISGIVIGIVNFAAYKFVIFRSSNKPYEIDNQAGTNR